MDIQKIYHTLPGRGMVVLLQKTGAFHLAGRFLKSGISRHLIPGYIAKHRIDMRDFEGQKYASFAEFFSRKKAPVPFQSYPYRIGSPCDGLLSGYVVSEGMQIAMKGSWYRLVDLVPDRAVAEQFADGLCLVFRLQASDYHHFCAIDDSVVKKTGYIPGELHSVQPIVCENLPVYRLNQRWWSVLDTVHFGPVLQIEVGAVLVGDVRFAKEDGRYYRGDEMGNFELAGSTILMIFSNDIRKRLRFETKYRNILTDAVEVPVRMGEVIGELRDETESRTGREA